jgi:hypothetical protein
VKPSKMTSSPPPIHFLKHPLAKPRLSSLQKMSSSLLKITNGSFIKELTSSHRVRAYKQLDTAHKSYLINPSKSDAFINSTHVITQAFQNINLHIGHLVSLLEKLGEEGLGGIVKSVQECEKEKLEATVKLYSGEGDERNLEPIVEKINEYDVG